MKNILKMIYIPKEAVSNLLVSLVAGAALLFFAIIPAHLAGQRLEQEIGDARYRLDEHNNLLPFYAALKKAPRDASTVLSVPEKTRPEKLNVDTALTKVRDISARSAMTLVAASPDLSNASSNIQSVAINVSLRGSFENFRSVLAGLGALPYVENVEDLSIQQEPNGRLLDFKIKLLLNLGNG